MTRFRATSRKIVHPVVELIWNHPLGEFDERLHLHSHERHDAVGASGAKLAGP